ncbi:MAG: extracellular solute-binding protein [Lachnospiraceae bacterium]|jgi:ABC-type glycerol-3-phosphate transport system substrate-binding protein|nr:extracellular solute-binding protein [Lachnospiraceae bacterium]
MDLCQRLEEAMKKQVFILILCLLILCTGCKTAVENAAGSKADLHLEEGDGLTVYVTGVSSTLLTEKEELTIYPSKYTVGPQIAGGEMNSGSGNIFVQALEEYSEKTGIKIEIHFLEETGEEGGDPLQFLYDQNRPLPDLLIASKHTGYDYERLARQGLLLDFTEYAEREGLLQEDDYYTQILEGGQIAGKQYTLPFLFNLNALLTSDAYLSEMQMPRPDQSSSYEEILYLLENSCHQTQSSNTKEAIWDASMRPAGKYLPNILTAAGYPCYWSVDQELLLQESAITKIFSLMEQYNQQEFVNILNWQQQSYWQNVNGHNKSTAIAGMEASAYEEIGIFLSGGRCGSLNFYSSLLTDAAYFHTAYQKAGEELVLCGIPSLQGVNTYSANITGFAVGFASTQYPEVCYDIARYLADYAYPPFYGFSVNRRLTEKQLQEAQHTSFILYPNDIWSRVMTGGLKQSEIESYQIKTMPLEPETIACIENMLDHIAGAGLPWGVLEREIYAAALGKLGDAALTPKQASAWVIEKLAEYQRIQSDLKPFYDEAYTLSFAE